jgi:hypothetical protein
MSMLQQPLDLEVIKKQEIMPLGENKELQFGANKEIEKLEMNQKEKGPSENLKSENEFEIYPKK